MRGIIRGIERLLSVLLVLCLIPEAVFAEAGPAPAAVVPETPQGMTACEAGASFISSGTTGRRRNPVTAPDGRRQSGPTGGTPGRGTKLSSASFLPIRPAAPTV